MSLESLQRCSGLYAAFSLGGVMAVTASPFWGVSVLAIGLGLAVPWIMMNREDTPGEVALFAVSSLLYAFRVTDLLINLPNDDEKKRLKERKDPALIARWKDNETFPILYWPAWKRAIFSILFYDLRDARPFSDSKPKETTLDWFFKRLKQLLSLVFSLALRGAVAASFWVVGLQMSLPIVYSHLYQVFSPTQALVFGYLYRWLMAIGLSYFSIRSVDLLYQVIFFFVGLEAEHAQQAPYLSRSLHEFWGKRWNRVIHHVLRRVFYQPTLRLLTRSESVIPETPHWEHSKRDQALRNRPAAKAGSSTSSPSPSPSPQAFSRSQKNAQTLAALSAFIGSGILHAYPLGTAFLLTDPTYTTSSCQLDTQYRWISVFLMFSYFFLQAILMSFEVWFLRSHRSGAPKNAGSQRGSSLPLIGGKLFAHLWTVGSIVLPAPLCMEPLLLMFIPPLSCYPTTLPPSS